MCACVFMVGVMEIASRKMELRRGRQSRDWASETDGRGDWSSWSLRTAVL